MSDVTNIGLPPFIAPVTHATVDDGILLCQMLYPALKQIGLFPALTGGVLYKGGNRKDIDIVIYRHRQDRSSGWETTNEDIAKVLMDCGITITGFFGFTTKASWRGIQVDILNPESCGISGYGESGEQSQSQQVLDTGPQTWYTSGLG